jgi:CubicO group peptidase (beta-lactamase class C family)
VRRQALPLALLVCACAAAPAPPAPQPHPLDALFAEWDRPDSPGCALGVLRAGRLVHARGYGMANLEHGIAIGPRTVFDIGSTSKQFTAACIGLLEQDGKLAVTDELRKYVPEIPDYGKPITLDQLLHHTSGLRDYLTLFALAGIESEGRTGDTETLAMLARQKQLNFEPGAEFLYSNSGYFLLSIVTRRVSGRTLAEFARERIFEPLGMKDTHIHDDHTLVVPARATGYEPRAKGGFGIDMSDFEQTGDGAVMTTLEDLARWDENFYDPKVGGPALLTFLRTRGTLADGKLLDYARGLGLGETNGLVYESHGGAWAGYRAQLLRFPSLHTSVVCLANLGSIDPSDLCWKVAALELGDELGPRGEPPSSRAAAALKPGPAREPREEWLGLYESEELGVRYRIARTESGLTVGIPGQETLPLEVLAPERLGVQGVELLLDGDGFTLSAGRVRGLRFVRLN